MYNIDNYLLIFEYIFMNVCLIERYITCVWVGETVKVNQADGDALFWNVNPVSDPAVKLTGKCL